MEKIELSGSFAGEIVDFNKAHHVELSDGFYKKTDSEFVVKVDGRFYRKNSPLIVKGDPDFYGTEYLLKEDSFPYGDYFLHKGHVISRNTANFESTGLFNLEIRYYHHSESFRTIYTVGSSATVSFKEARQLFDAGMIFIFNDSYFHSVLKVTVQNYSRRGPTDMPADHISMTFNPGNKFTNKSLIDGLLKEGSIVELNGSYWLSSQIKYSYDLSGKKYKPLSCNMTGTLFDLRKSPTFKLRTIGKDNRSTIEKIVSTNTGIIVPLNQVLRRQIFDIIEIDSDFKTDDSEDVETMFDGVTVVTNEDKNLINSLYKKIKSIASSGDVIARRDRVLDTHWFNGATELDSELFTSNTIGGQGGDFVYSRNKVPLSLSKTLDLTGGLGYTFGVEIETAAGVVPLMQADSIKCDIVGDRSISSMEYVTGVLHGDDGMKHLSRVCKTISDYCLVNDSCGVHVHIGTVEGAQKIVFDKEFSVYAVMLGCQLEKELFSFLPPNRMDGRNSSGLPYCGSILEFSGISLKSWKKKLSRYVLGPESEDVIFESLKDLINPSHRVGRWAAGRYKWLNLINCLTDNSDRRNGGGFQTIEFRLFNATSNPVDVRAFVLISMAFTYFCMERRELIETGNVSLKEVLIHSLSPASYGFVMEWLTKRKFLLAQASTKKLQKTF
jgi:hypothetical protein